MEQIIKELNVLAICNVLKDIVIKVEDSDLEELGLNKGVMYLISDEQQQNILQRFNAKDKKVEMGGSGPNVMRTMAALGCKVSQAGMVGSDYYGELYLKRVEELGIKNNIRKADVGSTGTSIILITPDGERTMNTHLGMSRCYTSADIPEADIARAKYLHVTGYQWDTDNQIEAINHAIRIAKKHNTKISFDLSDPFCVKRHRETFINIIEEYVDIVFSNLEEAKTLAEKELDGCLDMISSIADIAVVKCGSGGSWIKNGTEKIHIKANKIEIVDTTAAGDMYAGGFMYGLTRGLPLEICGRLASLCAETVIQQSGARIPDDFKSRIDNLLSESGH